ncbi:MAG: hypothetical protein K1X53_11655 [Candidatus Sumerlaeaceae bacterium]|nr:hypothetical protein [Candidatus Sumerlaeaceae bacterium]
MLNKLLTDEELLAMVQRADEFAKVLQRDGETQVVPMLELIYKTESNDNAASALGPLEIPDSLDERAVYMFEAGRLAALQGLTMEGGPMFPVAAMMLGEGWMITQQTQAASGVSPSLHPDRRECLAVNAMAVDGRECVVVYDLRRRGEGEVVLVPMAKEMVVHPFDPKVGVRSPLLAHFFGGVAAGLQGGSSLTDRPGE